MALIRYIVQDNKLNPTDEVYDINSFAEAAAIRAKLEQRGVAYTVEFDERPRQ